MDLYNVLEYNELEYVAKQSWKKKNIFEKKDMYDFYKILFFSKKKLFA